MKSMFLQNNKKKYFHSKRNLNSCLKREENVKDFYRSQCKGMKTKKRRKYYSILYVICYESRKIYLIKSSRK